LFVFDTLGVPFLPFQKLFICKTVAALEWNYFLAGNRINIRIMSNKQVFLTKQSPEVWRVTFNNPPVNYFGASSMAQFSEAVSAIEADKEVKVVIFDSAVEGFFITHSDFEANIADVIHLPVGATGLMAWTDVLVRISRAPVVSIAKIRGRATGNGSELALACDMRFASREKTIMGHFEVGAGIVPGGGPMSRLPRLIGRGRALEVLLGADDLTGDLAERYGYVNRCLPDGELDAFVDALAVRIASFPQQALIDTKYFTDLASLPPDAELGPQMLVCLASIGRPETQARIKTLIEQGLQKAGDAETRLGYYVGQLGKTNS
jgi:enoyl-CoA hydratase/carnithine racemase